MFDFHWRKEFRYEFLRQYSIFVQSFIPYIINYQSFTKFIQWIICVDALES